MTSKAKTYSELSDAASLFLVSLDARDQMADCAKKYGIAEGQLSDLSQLAEDVALGAVDAMSLPDVMATQFGVVAEKSMRCAADFFSIKLLPIANEIGIDAKSAMNAWGVDINEYKDIARINSASTMNVPAAPSLLQKTLAAKGATFSEPIMQHRLELIAASYRDGVRTREQAVGVLMRPVKTGGLEMNEIEAGKVLDMVGLQEQTEGAEGSRVEGSKILGQSSGPSDLGTSEPSSGPSGAKPDHFSEADAAEIAKVAEQKMAAMGVPEIITDTKAAADRIVREAGVSFASGELRTRFDHIIDARLRDVRDGFGTREKLEASAEAGGVGMSGAPLVAVMELVERMDAMHHLALGNKTDMLREKIVAEKAERVEKAQAQTAQEAQVMSQRYAEITGKAPDAHVETVPARASVAVPAAQATEQRAQAIDTSKVRAAIEAAKAQGPVVTPVMSAASIPATASGRPIVEDIRFERKLAGPVEELRMLSLSDFRRLSLDPKQAILRIRDKVELSAQEGYEHRIAAIKAWRESPLSQLYVSASREALMGGKGIVDVLADRRSRGEDTLRDDELHAIVELNGILRF